MAAKTQAPEGILTEGAVPGKTAKISDIEYKNSRKALLEVALRAARRGDIFPYVRYQWPELVIRDKDELADFKKYCTRTDNLDLRFDDFQIDILKHSFDRKHSQVLVSGGTKLGKGAVVGAFVVNCWFDIYPDSKIVLIGPDVEHVKKNLFAETLTWRRRMSSYKDATVKADCLTEKLSDPNNEQHFVMIANPKTGEGLSGIHSQHPLFVFDESSGQPDSRYTDSLSQCSSGLLVAIGNPRQPSGWFWRAFKGFDHGCKSVRSDAGPRRLVSIGLIDCINVRAGRVTGIIAPPGGMCVDGEVIGAGDVIPDHLRSKTKLLIPGQGCLFVCETLKRTVPPEEVEWRVYGRFPKDNKVFILFQPSYRELSTKKWLENKDRILPKALGIDVAASEHGDYCALAWGDTVGCSHIDLIRNPNLMMLKGEIYVRASAIGVELKGGYVPVAIDILQMGKMFADAMELDGVQVIRVGGSSGAERNKEQYVNRRAEMYGDLAAAVNPQLLYKDIWAIPDDDRLWEELFALEKIHGPDGLRWKANSKSRLDAAAKARNQDNRDSIFEKISRSPDSADALAYLHEAIMYLEDFYEESSNQFNPSVYPRAYRKTDYGTMQVELWDGKEMEMSKEDFHEKFGAEPKCLMF